MNLLDTNHLTPEQLKKAVQLRNCSRSIYIVLCNSTEPLQSSEVAIHVGEARAYVHMRLNQLVEQGLVKFEKGKHGKKQFMAV